MPGKTMENDTEQSLASTPSIIRLKIIEAASAMNNCSTQTVYNRAREQGWKRGRDSEGSWVEIPTDYLPADWVADYLKKQTAPKNDDELLPSSELLEKMVALMAEKLDDKYKALLETNKELLESKEKEIRSHQATIEALNNQIAAQNNQLVVLKEKNTDLKSSEPVKPTGFFDKLAFLFGKQNQK